MIDIMHDRLSDCKAYMNIDFDDDDTVINSLIYAADCYLVNAGVSRNVDTAMYDLIVNDMVLHMYDGRNEDTKTAATSQIARQMLTQLKFKCSYGDGLNENISK